MIFNNIILTKGNGPLYIQLHNEIKKLIINREIEDSYKLPPIREMALKLNINNVTVINAYKLLEEDGYITKKIGSGSYVKYNLGQFNTDKIDFTGRDSNIDSFPVIDITESLMSVLKNDGVNVFKYEDSEGYTPLKESLTKYFHFYNIDTKPEMIQIVSGGQQALDIISKALLDFGDTIISETPTYSGAINSFKGREAREIYINLQSDGLDIAELESKLQVRKPSFLYLMPFNQKPTGITYSYEKKLQILELANKYNFFIIEDDLGSELFSTPNNRTLKSMDRYDKVIYIKSFSPLFMPGLRLGCIIPPEKIFNKFLNIKEITDISTPGLIQRGFTHYLNKNSWKLYYTTLSKNISNKIDLTTTILNSDFSDLITFSLSNQSPLFWIKLKKGDALTLKNICSSNGIDITSGEDMGKDYSNYFLLNIKSIPLANIEKGLKILKESIEFLYCSF